MLSPDSARRAEALGYTNVKVFHDGMPDWKKAGNLVVSEAEDLKNLIEEDFAHVLIDLRPADEARKGFIPGAVSLPQQVLAASKEIFPSDKSAPIVLYSSDRSEGAFKIVRGWGYKNTTILNNGLRSWEKIGGVLASGEMATSISYVPKPRPGEISIEEFKVIIEQGSPDTIILDVREVEEAMNGMLKGALNIPSGQIRYRIADLPKDKEIITHCVTGIRAQTAYQKLKEKGYKARFLNAVIQIANDGTHEILNK